MRSLDDIDIEVVVHKDRTTHRGDPDRLFPDFKMIDSLCHQTVGDSVVTPRAEVKRDIDQTFRTFKNKFHLNLISDLRFQILDFRFFQSEIYNLQSEISDSISLFPPVPLLE